MAALRRANRPWRSLTCSLSRATSSALAAGGKVLGDQVHVAGLDAGQPRLAQTGAGRLEQEIEPIAGNRQRSLADAGMAGLVLDRDCQLARGHEPAYEFEATMFRESLKAFFFIAVSAKPA